MIDGRRPRFWQWPTILGLDAPAVAMAWQALLGRVGARAMGRRHILLLGLCVWLAYAADRWIEGYRLCAPDIRTQRHAFFHRWRWPAFGGWLGLLGATVALACRVLGPGEWLASLAVLGVAAAYLLVHQGGYRQRLRWIPKEACVALILTLGALLYPALDLSPGRGPDLAAVGALFAAAAFANCLLIGEWERCVDMSHGQHSLALRFMGTRGLARGLLGAVAAGGIALGCWGGPGALAASGWCACASASLLALLDAVEPLVGRERARSLADLTLLTPVAALWILRRP